jgi:predicted SprT family Zn-dependent metalloprotease
MLPAMKVIQGGMTTGAKPPRVEYLNPIGVASPDPFDRRIAQLEIDDERSGEARPEGLRPTGEQFGAYQLAYEFFNRVLFGNALPAVFLNFSRHNNSAGFYKPVGWCREAGGEVVIIPEISLNPDLLSVLSPRDVFAVLVHEIVHHWQFTAGKPSRLGYHNTEWAAKMESVGLMPSDSGLPGGRRVGQHMSHYVLEGGAFAKAFDAMPADYRLPWTTLPALPVVRPRGKEQDERQEQEQTQKAKSKTKYTCGCKKNKLWGKPDMPAFVCTVCGQTYKAAE